MTQRLRMHVKFLGVRGSVPTPTAENLGFGGNTTCLEVRSENNDRLVIDAGTGVRGLNRSPLDDSSDGNLQFHFLMTHFHWDHIQGLPFFAPLFQADSRIAFYSGKDSKTLQRILDVQLSEPYFPAMKSVAATREFIEFGEHPFHHGRITIHPFPLNHPQGAWGYRMESGGAVMVHASDLEHGNPKLDSVLREYSQNADVLIYDAQYSSEEYESKKGWGHSTWLEATRVARDARVKHLILFHHDPIHDDEAIRGIVEQARRQFENTDAAREGSVVSV